MKDFLRFVGVAVAVWVVAMFLSTTTVLAILGFGKLLSALGWV